MSIFVCPFFEEVERDSFYFFKESIPNCGICIKWDSDMGKCSEEEKLKGLGENDQGKNISVLYASNTSDSIVRTGE